MPMLININKSYPTNALNSIILTILQCLNIKRQKLKIVNEFFKKIYKGVRCQKLITHTKGTETSTYASL